MADNVTLPGTGAVVATDDVSGTQYQVVKLDVGGDGASLPLSATNRMPVEVLGQRAEDSVSASGDMGLPMLAVRQDSDTTAVSNDGDYAFLKMDEAGRLKVAVTPATYAVTTGNVTSASSAVSLNVSRVSNVMVHCSGTFAGANCTFEGSLNSTNGTDGNWFGVQAIRSNANTIELTTGVLGAAPAYGWELSVNALNWFRIRATAWTSGTQVWAIQPGAYATEPIPGAQVSGTQAVSGTVTASSVTGNVAAAASASGNPIRIGGTARTTNPTAVTDGQVSNVMTDKMGRLVVVNQHHRNLVSSQATTITSSVAATTIIAAGGASVFRDISHLSVTNGSATATLVTLTGATGTFIWNVPAGGGLMQNFDPPLPASAANAVWTITCGTSVASIYVNAVFVGNL